MRDSLSRLPHSILLAIALLLPPAAAPLRSQELPKGYDQGLFEVRVPGNAAVTLPALMSPAGGVLLPVGAILTLTGLTDERSRGDSVRSIPELGGDRRTVLDLTIREIRRSGQRLPIGPEEAIIVAGEMYLLTDRLAEFLQADVTLDWSTLIVVLSRNPPFPAERKRDVDSRRSAARERTGFGVTLRPPDVGYRSRNGGYVLEWSASTSSHDVVRSLSAQTRLGLAVAGGDLSLGVIHTATPGPEVGRWQGTSAYRRAFPSWAALRQVEAGDIVVGGATFQAVRGINFTNAAIVRDQFFSTLAVDPSVPVGWEYEVYQSGQLIGYSDASTRGGIGVPLRYGTTPVQVRLLSPSGEEILTNMTFLVPPTLIQPGRLEYALGAGKCSAVLCDRFGYVDLKYGARQWLTLGGGAQRAWGAPSSELLPYGSVNYAHFSGWQAEMQAARALFSRASVSYYGLAPINGSVTAGLTSPGIGQPSFLGAAERRWYGDGRLGYRLRVARPMVSSMRVESRVEGTRSTPNDHYRVSAFADRQSGSLGLHYERDRADSLGLTTISALTILPARGPRWLQYTGITTSAGFRGSGFELLEVNSSVRLARTTSLGVAARYNQRARATSASISLNNSLGFARSTSRVTAAPNRGTDATTTLSGVATFDPRLGVSGYEMGGIGSSGITGVVFYDFDGDGRLGPADSVAAGIGLVIGGQRQRTDSRGRYRAWNIVPYELVEITVDTLKGLAPEWIPLRVQQYTRATPHMYNRFDVPLAQTREVAGQVVADSGIWTSAGISLRFRNIETGLTSTAVTFSDGAFYVSRMKPGQYEVTVAQSALDALGALAVPDRVVLTIPLRGQDLVIDVPPIHLAKPKPVEEKVVALPPPPLFTKRVLTLKGVTFELNKAELTTSSYDVLDSIATALKDVPEIRIEIAGHTDATGSRARNMTLSEARAQAVRDHFIFKSVDSARMIARGYGPDQPVATNRTAEGRALNRRTELRRLDEPGDSARVVTDSLKALPSAEYSVQVGVFRSGPAAIDMRDRLVKAGIDARIVGDEPPFRVRVGRLATRREAQAIVARLQGVGVAGIVVRAELR